MKALPLDVRYFGVVGDGCSDDHEGLQRALDAGRDERLPVLIPAGLTCAYDGVLTCDACTLRGEGDASVLYALNPQAAALYVIGAGSVVTRLRFTGPMLEPEMRWPNYEGKRIVVRDAATDFLVSRNLIDQGIGAGLHVGLGASHGRIIGNRIRETLADSIHVTDGAAYVTIEDNHADHCGDDGVAVVSYIDEGNPDAGPCHDITARRNIITNQWGGRAMSVVGGERVLYENNSLIGNHNAAGLYIASESSYNTFGVANVLVRHNLIRDCGNPDKGHYAALIFGREGYPVVGVTLARNVILSDYYGGIDARTEYADRMLIDANLVDADPDYRCDDAIVTPYESGPVGVLA
jgi:hypothetical protein